MKNAENQGTDNPSRISGFAQAKLHSPNYTDRKPSSDSPGMGQKNPPGRKAYSGKNDPDSIGKRIKQYRKKAGISQKDLGEMMNVTRNTVINWEADKYRPDADLFPELCSILNISINELFGLPSSGEQVSGHERVILHQYRQISPVSQRIIDHMISTILDEEVREKDRLLDESVRMLDYISTAAAAGNGLGFGDVPIEDYRFVYLNDRSEKADGIIQVRGDSMLPVYHNGDFVYVQYTNAADEGEDIVCSSREGIHIKRLGENGPYSLNKEYPFLLNSPEDQVQVIGRVLGIVSSSDCPNPLEMESVEVIRHDEILDFKRKHGMQQ